MIIINESIYMYIYILEITVRERISTLEYRIILLTMHNVHKHIV